MNIASNVDSVKYSPNLLGREMKLTYWSEKLYQWREYAEALYTLRNEVLDIFATKYIWGNHGNSEKRHYEADGDTVFLLKLADKLNDVCDFVNSHIGILEHKVDIEEDIRANLEQSFEAWKRGLCPALMRSVQRYVKADSTREHMSYETTQRAIREWQLSQEKLKLSA